MRRKIILITGANGEIGHGLINALHTKGMDNIVALDLHPISEFIENKILEGVIGNILDTNLLEQINSEYEIKEISEYSNRKEEILVNLSDQKIIFGNKEIKFEIDQFKKKCLLEGLDDIALSLEKSDKIVSFEKKLKSTKPWIFNDQN